jgi:hypothetical protein
VQPQKFALKANFTRILPSLVDHHSSTVCANPPLETSRPQERLSAEGTDK